MQLDTSQSKCGRCSPPVTGFDAVEYDFNIDGEKSVLLFPSRGYPSIVSLGRLALKELNYSPFLSLRAKGKAGPKLLRRTFVSTAELKTFMLIFGEQSKENRSHINEFLTDALGCLADGLRRPWIGPLLVEYDREEVLASTQSVFLEINDVVRHLHMVYDRVHPEPNDTFDPLPYNVGVVWIDDGLGHAESNRPEDAELAVSQVSHYV
ncbi:hypothetical protein VNI00_011526 [Paramarasmius palmivorus]|uniref:Uncharacterized protein n=1 Tax=Paramarasmius palmivorus TaxID=297713 RepID=A0AAW0CEK9_9AGAR